MLQSFHIILKSISYQDKKKLYNSNNTKLGTSNSLSYISPNIRKLRARRDQQILIKNRNISINSKKSTTTIS